MGRDQTVTSWYFRLTALAHPEVIEYLVGKPWSPNVTRTWNSLHRPFLPCFLPPVAKRTLDIDPCHSNGTVFFLLPLAVFHSSCFEEFTGSRELFDNLRRKKSTLKKQVPAGELAKKGSVVVRLTSNRKRVGVWLSCNGMGTCPPTYYTMARVAPSLWTHVLSLGTLLGCRVLRRAPYVFHSMPSLGIDSSKSSLQPALQMTKKDLLFDTHRRGFGEAPSIAKNMIT